jgi:GT2 family glycosyltransferase
MAAEVIVVDNNSSDNSIEFLKPAFPGVCFIANKENLGFAKACNQGVAISKGKYILFLNPDTIVPEDCFLKCISFLDAKENAGALGIKMLDGSGRFLKESKRGFPSPAASLYKLFGLSKLFPHSAVFSKYHAGHLDKDQNHEIEVLAGAFLMVKKEVLDRTGGFDETFFMYGEDIDLSYRIIKEGYKNYYFAESSIIHFKGESTRKESLNYVKMFYNAMSIFVRKHYGQTRAGIFNFLIQLAIWFRAGLTAAGSFIRKIGLPVIDAGLILISFWVMKGIWNEYVKTDTRYENWLLWIAFPAFTVMYLLAAYYAGLYDKWYKRSELIQSTLIATVVIIAGYSLLPEEYRFSRGILLFGAMLAFLMISLLRWFLTRTGVLISGEDADNLSNTIIVGSPSEYEEVTRLMSEARLKEKVIGRVAVKEDDKNAIGFWSRTDLLGEAIPFREVIFCEGTLSFADIIDEVSRSKSKIKIKIHAAGSRSIVGSHSKDTSGEAVSKENGLKLANPYYLRLKRLLDVSVAIIGLLFFPVHIFLVKKPLSFFANCFTVIAGQKTWVGYLVEEAHLPKLRKAVLGSNGTPVNIVQQLPTESLQMLDYWYARDYELINDITIIWKMYRKLGGP